MKSYKVPFKSKKIVLAFGPQAKNTLCLIAGSIAYVSAEHRDLSNPKDFMFFSADLRKLLKKKPGVFAFDLHPEYQSTKFAQELSQRLGIHASGVQHHHAHIASCMVDNGLKNKKVIGVAFDGTGFGDEGKIWGAEFLICDYQRYKRAAHLKEIPLLGGERAVLEPWRLAAAWLGNADFAPKVYRDKWRILKRIDKAGVNVPLASSMGRLFDAAACLIIKKYKAGFEGEFAVRLNKLAEKSVASSSQRCASYPFLTKKTKDIYIFDPAPIFKKIIRELKAGKPRELIAYEFHLTVAQIIRKACLILRKETGLKAVALSGGVFQNKLLLRLVSGLLYKEGFLVLTHQNIPCNDSGISLGEAAVAAYRS